jgi:ribosome maturation factor RimP
VRACQAAGERPSVLLKAMDLLIPDAMDLEVVANGLERVLEREH